ncbi:MAG: organoarsenical effux MFS transporter ArsJ [Alphaproteobacteria bacterium]|nr:organoarsenical effux MFS transporter ArsJ [Alphaproteobacteria bacterium]
MASTDPRASLPGSLRDYGIVTAAYWAFTLTDGALRMLVLLYFHGLGYSPLDLATLFLLYEAMGIVTNFFGGWIGAHFGLRVTLFAGLAVQIAALTALSFLDPTWALGLSVAFVMGTQALSGVAKDLTKMSSKSAVKSVVKKGDQGGLFKWVAVLTGSKNALKGAGFFLGGLLLEVLGFQHALYAMAAMLAVVLIGAVGFVTADLGKAKTKIAGKDLFSKTREINLLSAARVFLFASRDVWFVVAVPIFLYDMAGWSFTQVGTFMAAWVIGYGMVQAAAPKLLGKNSAESGPVRAKWLCAALTLIPAGMAVTLMGPDTIPILIGGLLVYGVVFALNSSVHSYLIVAYSDHDKVALNVGFYYMANAAGRLGGTFLSGLVYQLHGMEGALWASCALLALTLVFTLPLKPAISARSAPA